MHSAPARAGRRRRRRSCPLLLVALVLAAVAAPAASADTNLLSNGTFDTSTAGWAATNAALSLAPDGTGGTTAGLVSSTGGARKFSIQSTATETTIAATGYVADASVRSATPGRKVCLIVTELAGSRTKGSNSECVTSASAWQPFPSLQYAAVRSGDTLVLAIQEQRAKSKDSFEVDDVTLEDPFFAAPAMTAAPSIAGTAADGETLTADPGVWDGTQPITFAYQWQSSSDGSTWTNIAAGATGSSYTATHADVGRLLRVLVTATNAAGSAVQPSAATAPVAASPPSAGTPPVISGAPVVGSTLTASSGSWSGTPPFRFSYAWQSSGDGGTTWNAVGTDSATYVPGDTDVGAILRVVVTATNGAGAASAPSAPTQAILTVGETLTDVAPPSVTGLAVDTATLTADPGTWTGTGTISFAFQWLRCGGDGSGCVAVTGATAPTYTLQPGDEGSTFAVTVAATDALGTASVTSAVSSVVQPICGAASTATPPATYSHVIWIWMENRSYGTIIGPPGSTAAGKSPFVNGALVHDCGLATNYHNVSHPSLPNYIAATSGSTQGLQHDTLHHYTVTSLFDQVQQAGLEWRSYNESMPQNCDPLDADPYAADHNPALDYTGLTDTCPLWDVPLGDATTGALATDLANGTLASFSFVIPNGCNSSESCPVATGDAWLAAWLPLIVSSPEFQSGTTAVFLTWDEGQNGTAGEDCLANLTDESCHVPLVVITPYTVAGTQSATQFTHYSLLGTTEQLLGLSLLGSAADPATASLRPDFHF